MGDYMDVKIKILIPFVTLFFVTNGYAADPASMSYVNQRVQELRNEFNDKIGRIPSGPIGPIGPPGPQGLPGQYTPGPGIEITNGLISATGTLAPHAIGDKALGGTVFYINQFGTHGLVASNVDQAIAAYWSVAQDSISNYENYDQEGKIYVDWRLPTKFEINLMYQQSALIGGFSDGCYLTSTSANNDTTIVWCKSFSSGNFLPGSTKSALYNTRAVRTF